MGGEPLKINDTKPKPPQPQKTEVPTPSSNPALEKHFSQAESDLKRGMSLPSVVERAKMDIADSLDTNGFSKVAEYVRNLDVSAFNSFEDFKNAVIDYLSNIQPGLSMKKDTSVGVSPASVANKIAGGDIPLIQDYVNDPSLANLLKLQPVIDSAGLGSLDPSVIQRFFKEVIAESNKSEGGLITGNEGTSKVVKPPKK